MNKNDPSCGIYEIKLCTKKNEIGIRKSTADKTAKNIEGVCWVVRVRGKVQQPGIRIKITHFSCAGCQAVPCRLAVASGD